MVTRGVVWKIEKNFREWSKKQKETNRDLYPLWGGGGVQKSFQECVVRVLFFLTNFEKRLTLGRQIIKGWPFWADFTQGAFCLVSKKWPSSSGWIHSFQRTPGVLEQGSKLDTSTWPMCSQHFREVHEKYDRGRQQKRFGSCVIQLCCFIGEVKTTECWITLLPTHVHENCFHL